MLIDFTYPWQYERCFAKSFGWYESPESLFIAMEYYELGDLHTYLDRKPPLSECEAREITYQILDGLDLMHDNQFAHEDLKPSVSFHFSKNSQKKALSNLAFSNSRTSS